MLTARNTKRPKKTGEPGLPGCLGVWLCIFFKKPCQRNQSTVDCDFAQDGLDGEICFLPGVVANRCMEVRMRVGVSFHPLFQFIHT